MTTLKEAVESKNHHWLYDNVKYLEELWLIYSGTKFEFYDQVYFEICDAYLTICCEGSFYDEYQDEQIYETYEEYRIPIEICISDDPKLAANIHRIQTTNQSRFDRIQYLMGEIDKMQIEIDKLFAKIDTGA